MKDTDFPNSLSASDHLPENDVKTLVYWRPLGQAPAFTPKEIGKCLEQFRTTTHIIRGEDGRLGLGLDGEIGLPGKNLTKPFTHLGTLPPLYPEWLGDRSFGEAHHVRFPYIAGSMANGISSVRLVSEAGKGGFLGFFGAAGLPLDQLEKALVELKNTLGDQGIPWGTNLIHSPSEPALEEALVDLTLSHSVTRIEASAYMALTPALVRYAASGLTTDPSGVIRRKNHILAKISREEVATHFLKPPPAEILHLLVRQGRLSQLEAQLAARIPLAEDITVEADSGGHTDNRPLGSLFPTILNLRDRIASEYGYKQAIRIGAGGGLGTPAAVAAAFALGAAYVVTGSVNQAAVESGLHASGKALLAEAGIADVAMAPAADMFEMGVSVQVLLRGTMFAVRARKLYDIYRKYPSLESIPTTEREEIETRILRARFPEAWASTRSFWAVRSPHELEKAEADPRHKMALVFRSYLGLSSRWAVTGEPERAADYQIWCSPAMGAFNSWVNGSFLATPGERKIVQIGRNLMEGAAVVTRAQQVRSAGLPVPQIAFNFRPRRLA